MTKMPIVFVGHGSPLNAIEDNDYTKEWQQLASMIPRPKAILAISAHWCTSGTRLQSTPDPVQIYDFHGFPKQLSQLIYPVKGSLELTQEVQKLIPVGLTLDDEWGIDHGTWSVLSKMYPEADIPVVQLSIDYHMPAFERLAVGALLKPLRELGYLIFASGNIVHNLSRLDLGQKDTGYRWAVDFDNYIHDHIHKRDFEAVVNYHKAGDCATYAFTTTEHFDPLLYILGATEPEDSIKTFNKVYAMGSLSMTGYVIG